MLRGLYSAATAMDAATLNQEVISHNLAHVNVPGFRRSVMAYETFETSLDRQLDSDSSSTLGTRASKVVTDFEMGRLETTGRPLDVALAGEGFFVLEGPNGPLYTRSGVFHVAGDGTLVNAGGIPVRGGGGPIQLPEQAAPSQVQIGADGLIYVNHVQVGQLELVRFDDPQQLIAAGTTTFEAPPDVVPQPAQVTVVQGAHEGSNVSAIDEMVRMIAGMRYFEASQRAMRTIGEAVHQHTNPEAS